MTTDERERAEFEAWARQRPFLIAYDVAREAAWLAWKARAALAATTTPAQAPAQPVAWGQLGTLNGATYLRMNYDGTPYPPPADVVRNLNLVPLYAAAPAQAAHSAPEVRLNDDGTLDELVGVGHFHLEQMDSNVWWLCLQNEAGGRAVWLRAKGKITAHHEPREPVATQTPRPNEPDLGADGGAQGKEER